MIKKIAIISALALAFLVTAGVVSADTHAPRNHEGRASSTHPNFDTKEFSRFHNASSTEQRMELRDKFLKDHASSTASSTRHRIEMQKHFNEASTTASSTKKGKKPHRSFRRGHATTTPITQ